MNNRWWIYQRERFPLLAHGPLVVVFCVSVMLFSSLQDGQIPDVARFAGATISTLILFFQLRVADEFKDFEIDSRYRAERPVPRGLVTLSELARLSLAGALIQFLLAVQIDIGLLPILVTVWLYMGLMTVEFFVPAWLKRTPSVYLLSHMLVMPLIAFYVSAFDWLCTCRALPGGLGWLLLLSFGCGLVLELGRKIKPPAAEREGVETYSGLWGTGNSISLWVAAVATAVTAYSMAVTRISDSELYVFAGISLFCGVLIIALLFRSRAGRSATATWIEPCSGIVTMLLYLGLGPLQAVVA
jgi:4-hydroxybenzoate polyprenyltransferase